MSKANKIILNGETLIDLTNDTVTPNKLAKGFTAHDKSGAIIEGTLEDAKKVIKPISITENGTYEAEVFNGYTLKDNLTDSDIAESCPTSSEGCWSLCLVKLVDGTNFVEFCIDKRHLDTGIDCHAVVLFGSTFVYCYPSDAFLEHIIEQTDKTWYAYTITDDNSETWVKLNQEEISRVSCFDLVPEPGVDIDPLETSVSKLIVPKSVSIADAYNPITVNVSPKSVSLVATKNGTYFPNIDGGCSDTLSWDGNTEGLESTAIATVGTTYKISECVPTEEDLINGITIVYRVGDERIEDVYTSVSQMVDSDLFMNDGLISIGPGGYIVPYDNFVLNGKTIFKTKGIYFGIMNYGAVMESITIPNYTGFNEKADAYSAVVVNVESSGGFSMKEFIKARGGASYLFCGDAYNFINTVTTDNDLIKFFPNGDELGDTTIAYSMFYTCENITTLPWFDTSKITEMGYFASDCKNLVNIPNYDTGNVVSFYSAFSGDSSLQYIPQLDLRSATDCGSMFNNCTSLIEIPELNTKNVTSMGTMFGSCSSLETIRGLDMRSCTSTWNTFLSCNNLKNATITNIITEINFSSCYNLTLDSLLKIIYELHINTATKAKTLTVGSTNINKLASTYVKLIDITDDMRAEDDLIDNKLPFVVCESADEGAMLITDYVSQKNWTLK